MVMMMMREEQIERDARERCEIYRVRRRERRRAREKDTERARETDNERERRETL